MSKFKLINLVNEDILKEDDPDRARGDSTTSDSSKLNDIVSELMLPSSADQRIVVYLTATELKSHYLKQGGGAQFIDVIEDDELVNIAKKSGGNRRIVEFSPGFKFSDILVKPSGFSAAERAVIIDVPKQIFNAIESSRRRVASALADDAAKQAFREDLKKIMSHKYYVLTLNMVKAQRIVREMDSKSGTDEWAEVFNPEVIENYPIKQTLVAAKNEWNREHGEVSKRLKDITSKEREAKFAEREREAAKKLAGGSDELAKILINAVIANGGKPDDEIASKIKDGTSSKYEQSDVVSALNKLSTDYGQTKFADIAVEVGKITPWR